MGENKEDFAVGGIDCVGKESATEPRAFLDDGLDFAAGGGPNGRERGGRWSSGSSFSGSHAIRGGRVCRQAGGPLQVDFLSTTGYVAGIMSDLGRTISRYMT